MHWPSIHATAAWINEQNPVALINGGDGQIYGAEMRYSDLVHVPQEDGGLGINPAIVDLPVPGNHDADESYISPFGNIGPDPFSQLKADYPGLFQGREWYDWSHAAGGTSVRVMVGNNITDCINPITEKSCYHNCNPPGDETLNPDHSGWTVPGSPQLQWLDVASSSWHTWKIGAFHRPMWSNRDGDGRPMHSEGREALCLAVENGLDIVLGGDQHSECLAGRFHPGVNGGEEVVPDSANGVYALNLSGGFSVRPPDDSLLPPGSLLWSSGAINRQKLMQAAAITFQGETARIKIWEIEKDQPGGVVHEQSLVLNRGLPS